HICYSPIMLRRNTRPTLLPYTTLFRSSLEGTGQEEDLNLFLNFFLTETGFRIHSNSVQHPINFMPVNFLTIDIIPVFRIVKLPRSEEHTSELQSRENLVCRLLLEKKKH